MTDGEKALRDRMLAESGFIPPKKGYDEDAKPESDSIKIRLKIKKTARKGSV